MDNSLPGRRRGRKHHWEGGRGAWMDCHWCRTLQVARMIWNNACISNKEELHSPCPLLSKSPLHSHLRLLYSPSISMFHVGGNNVIILFVVWPQHNRKAEGKNKRILPIVRSSSWGEEDMQGRKVSVQSSVIIHSWRRPGAHVLTESLCFSFKIDSSRELRFSRNDRGEQSVPGVHCLHSKWV